MVFKEGYAKTHSLNLPSKNLNPQNLINTSSCLREFKCSNMITYICIYIYICSSWKIQVILSSTRQRFNTFPHKPGPAAKDACSNLATHNRDQRRRANHCPRCNWFDRNWNKWPEWDGNSDLSRGHQKKLLGKK